MTPADIRRVKPEEDANLVAIEQARALLHRLPEQGFNPLFVFDAGYDPVRLQLGLENHPAQVLVRLHSDRVFYADPEDPEKRPVGRTFRHGKRFDLKDPRTWPEPATEHHSQTGDYGSVRVRAWSGLHPKTRRAAERYGSESAAVVRGTVVMVEVERLPSGERRRKPKKLWLWWHGEGKPDLDLLWRSYCRRKPSLPASGIRNVSNPVAIGHFGDEVALDQLRCGSRGMGLYNRCYQQLRRLEAREDARPGSELAWIALRRYDE